jgi:hypothetical protein
MEESKSIPFEDKGYEERRRILRYDYMHNTLHHKAVKLLAYQVQSCLREAVTPELRNLDTIIKFLIDGFLAYEIIRDQNGYSVGIKELDPVTLEPFLDGEGNKMWVQYKDTQNMRMLTDSNIYYFAYSGPNNAEMTFMQSLYTGLIDSTDKKFIKKHVFEIVKKLSH